MACSWGGGDCGSAGVGRWWRFAVARRWGQGFSLGVVAYVSAGYCGYGLIAGCFLGWAG